MRPPDVGVVGVRINCPKTILDANVSICTLYDTMATAAAYSPYAVNLRRLMARLDLTIEQLVDKSGLSERTVKGILNGQSKPQARTIRRLAATLDVSVDEFFWPPVGMRPVVPEPTVGEIRAKFDSLLASDQRELVIELVEALARRGGRCGGMSV